jgi:4-amino-4-deoxy-L-arabinose transferase-like glycosyltransferase
LLTTAAGIPRSGSENIPSQSGLKQLLPILCIVGMYLFFALYRLGWADLSPDEGRYGLVAVNILTDHKQLAILSEDPLGGPGTKPFMYAVSLASSVLLFGKNEFALRAASVVALLAAGLILFAVVDSCLGDRTLSVLMLFFFLLNPWTISYARTAMPEPTLVFWGCFSLFAGVRFVKTRSLIWALACGLGLGLAFLTKLWLVLPFAVAAIVFFAAMWISGPRGRIAAAALISCAGFMLAAASHLFLVLHWTPADFGHWFRLYFIVSLSNRAAGHGEDPVMWFHPWWFYLGALFKATFFALPLVYFAIYTLIRRRQHALIVVLAAMLSPFLILSLFTVKQSSYAYPAFPALAFLLAYGTLAAVRTRPLNALVVATLLSAATALFFFIAAVITLPQLCLIGGLYSLYIAASFASERYRLVSGVALAGVALAAMLAADTLAVRASLQHRTYYRNLASYVRPLVAHSAPQAVVFQAPEFPSLEFYLFRTGEYWQTYYFHESYTDFLDQLKKGDKAFYVVDPTGKLYGGKISTDELNALHKYAEDETPAIERVIGRKLRVQVFVSQAWTRQHTNAALAQRP